MLKKVLADAGLAGSSLKVLTAAGVVRPYAPWTLAALGRTLLRWGVGPAGGFKSLAVRAPEQVGIIDELGSLTWAQVDERSTSLALALRALGVGEGDGVAVMCRNHRGFIDATVAGAKLGADVVYLNTAFSGPQLIEVLERDRVAVLIHDQEFTGLVAGADVEHRIVSWVDDADTIDGVATSDDLIAATPAEEIDPPERTGRIIILTSGTTGTPKGAPRSDAGIDAAVALLSALPLKAGWHTHIAAPLFHTWGFAHMAMSMLLGSTMVLRRRFDPEGCLEVTQQHGCESIVVIPVMLQRILALPQETQNAYDLSKVEVVASSGSALPGDLATRWMDQFGDNLYSTYGSTEVAYAAVANPTDLRAAPDSAGHPPYRTTVKILDDRGHEVPRGTSGRIFVGNGMLFEGYTGGGHKEVVDGLMSSGDVGRIGDDGRLYIEGRDDEMIVSGGENVFPKEVEDCLARHEGVHEAAAIGVDDDEFGKRLRAFVVLSDAAVTEEHLKNWVRSNLARYKVPRDWVFLEELPRNATGKVLKKELATHELPGTDA